jgi:hypothetical protein
MGICTTRIEENNFAGFFVSADILFPQVAMDKRRLDTAAIGPEGA